eukprot:SAG31_NODE_14704_length_791_cov_1.541908_1_plen_145_part_00
MGTVIDLQKIYVGNLNLVGFRPGPQKLVRSSLYSNFKINFRYIWDISIASPSMSNSIALHAAWTMRGATGSFAVATASTHAGGTLFRTRWAARRGRREGLRAPAARLCMGRWVPEALPEAPRWGCGARGAELQRCDSARVAGFR